jgi:hypothetical protein
MEWKIKIEGKQDQRIVVKFDSLKEELTFIGQYKVKMEWFNFSEKSISFWLRLKDNQSIIYLDKTHNDVIDVEIIQNLLLEIYAEMNKRLDAYINISEGFEHIKLIEIKEE